MQSVDEARQVALAAGGGEVYHGVQPARRRQDGQMFAGDRSHHPRPLHATVDAERFRMPESPAGENESLDLRVTIMRK